MKRFFKNICLSNYIKDKSVKGLQLKIPLFALLFISLCLTFHTSVFLSGVPPSCPVDIYNNIQDSPYLINFLKENVIIKSSRRPYNLANPQMEDFSQFLQGEVLDEYFATKKNGTFIEVGAYDGESFSNTLFLERKHGWTGLLIEPIPSAFKELVTKNRKVQAAECCLSQEVKPTQVSFRIKEMFSSIKDEDKESNEVTEKEKVPKLETNEAKEKEKKETKEETEIKITCYPLYSLMVAADLTTVDLLSLDLEGSEIKVLKTIPWDRVDIKAIMIEINHIPEGENFLEGYLTALNYVLVKKLRIDYLFVKK